MLSFGRIYISDNEDEAVFFRIYDKKRNVFVSNYIESERQVRAEITKHLNWVENQKSYLRFSLHKGQQDEPGGIDDLEIIQFKVSKNVLKKQLARAFYPKKYGKPLETLVDRINNEQNPSGKKSK